MGQPIQGDSTSVNQAGVLGTNTDQGGRGVYGESFNGFGVWGFSQASTGVTGDSTNGHGVLGHSANEHGVWGESDNGSGVVGIGHKWIGVYGQADDQVGVFGQSTTGKGVVGLSKGASTGVEGTSTDGIGVWGSSANFEGVHAETNSTVTAAIAAYNLNPNGTGAAIYAKKAGGGNAGFFEGDLYVTGTVTAKVDVHIQNADFAEEFTVTDETEAGEVMVLTENGTLTQSTKAYDKKVVGVISGAGKYKPGIIMDKQNNTENRKPIAMMGKVYCKVDADVSPIETGDMLTSSDIPGYAMKALDPFKAFGSVIGKALAALKEGKGLIPILVVLQ